MTSFRIINLLVFFSCAQTSIAEEVVNVYSARHYATDMALNARFTEETGIKVTLIEGGSAALIQRIVNEGEFSPADMMITVDAGRLWRAAEKDIFQAIESPVLNERVPAHLRHPSGLWFGLSKRARVIAYNASKGLPAGLTRYEDLARVDLKGQICMRSSGNIYNLSLLASIIEANGDEQAQKWANGVVAKFARKPQSNDTGQLRAVAAGECSVTVANTYYLGRLLGSEKAADQAVVKNLGVLFPNQAGRGSHINISGAGITKYAPNKANAVRFLEYLTSDFAQRLFAEGNNEYPVVGEVTGPVAELGAFAEDNVSASVLGQRQAKAVKIFDRAGWL